MFGTPKRWAPNIEWFRQLKITYRDIHRSIFLISITRPRCNATIFIVWFNFMSSIKTGYLWCCFTSIISTLPLLPNLDSIANFYRVMSVALPIIPTTVSSLVLTKSTRITAFEYIATHTFRLSMLGVNYTYFFISNYFTRSFISLVQVFICADEGRWTTQKFLAIRTYSFFCQRVSWTTHIGGGGGELLTH